MYFRSIYWYATRRVRDERPWPGRPRVDPQTIRLFLLRGLTVPVIFLLTIGVSFFSVGAAIYSWLLLIVIDTVILRRRRIRAEPQQASGLPVSTSSARV
jgi:hypothetical protein